MAILETLVAERGSCSMEHLHDMDEEAIKVRGRWAALDLLAASLMDVSGDVAVLRIHFCVTRLFMGCA